MTVFKINDIDILHNIKTVRERAGVPVWGVLKYNGYGMGAVHMAELLRESGITRFAAANAAEGHALREAGFTKEEILLLSPQSTEEEVIMALRDGLLFSVGSAAYAARITELARRERCFPKCHIAVDTGMGRFGFLPEQYEEIRRLCSSGEIAVKGIYSHFAAACSDEKATKRQFTAFCGLLCRMEDDGLDFGMAHIANSPGLFRFKDMQLDAVRIGSALVGRVAGTDPLRTGLRKVGVLVAEVCDVRTLPRGSHVGYGGEARLFRDSKTAVLSAGRQCGIPGRSRLDRLTGRFQTAVIRDRRVNIIASGSASHAIADVTGIDVHPGDPAYIDVNPLRVDTGVTRVYEK